VNEPIEYRITESGVGHQLVPVRGRELARDDGGVNIVSVFEDIEELDLFVVIEFRESPVIDDEDMGFRDCMDEFMVASITSGNGKVPGKAVKL